MAEEEVPLVQFQDLTVSYGLVRALAGVSGVFSGYLRGGQRARILAEFLRTQRLVEVDAQSIAVARH